MTQHIHCPYQPKQSSSSVFVRVEQHCISLENILKSISARLKKLSSICFVTVGFTADKKQVVEQLARSRNNKVIAILLQETHDTNPDFLAIAGYELRAYTTSEHHGIATFVSQVATWPTLARSHSNSDIEWLAIRIDDRLTPTSSPAFGNQCIYVGFYCQHSEWGYHI